MNKAIEQYLVEWASLKDQELLAFLKESLPYVTQSNVDVSRLSLGFEQLADKGGSLSFDVAQPPLIMPESAAVQWKLRCDMPADLGRYQTYNITGAEFVKSQAGYIRSVDLYFDTLQLEQIFKLLVSAPGGEKYSRSGLSASSVEAVAAQVRQLLEEEQLYLDSELSLPKLAETMGLQRHHVSQAINDHFKENFFGLVTSYRIAEVKKRLSDERFAAQSVIDIALSVGFNSKSAFNDTFKKFTGVTPSRFRDEKRKLEN